MSKGHEFHARAAATRKARSPMVERFVAETMRSTDDADQSLALVGTSATG